MQLTCSHSLLPMLVATPAIVYFHILLFHDVRGQRDVWHKSLLSDKEKLVLDDGDVIWLEYLHIRPPDEQRKGCRSRILLESKS